MRSDRIGDLARGAAFVAAALLAASGPSHAIDYEPISLACLIANADAVVVARLPDEIGQARYSAILRRALVGEIRADKLDISEPAPWRGTPPDTIAGEALLFLRRAESGGWRVIGPSGDGHVALGDQEADVRGIGLPGPHQAAASHSRDELVDAIAAAGRCFAFEAQPKSVSVIARCGEQALGAISARSALHAGLIGQLREAEGAGLLCRF